MILGTNSKCLQSLSPPVGSSDFVQIDGRDALKFSNAYDMACTRGNSMNWASWVWCPAVPRRTCLLVWKIFHDGLLTQVKLQRIGFSLASRCELCCSAVEDLDHILFNCSFSMDLWCRGWSSIPSSLDDLLQIDDRRQQVLAMLILSLIWRERNWRIFRGCFNCPKKIFDEAVLTLASLC